MMTDIREVVGTGFGPIRMDRYMHTQTDEDHFYNAPQSMLFFFPRGVLDEILNLIESVSEGFPSYFCFLFPS